MKNMGDILRQAQLMQHKIAKMQQEMGEKDFSLVRDHFTGGAGGQPDQIAAGL